MGRLENKVALITGAARGHAEAMARRFAAEGADIAMCDIVPRDQLDSTTGEAVRGAGRRALCFETDVSEERQVNDMVERTLAEFGKIDIMAPVVGIAGPTKDLHELTLAEWRQVQTVNVDSAFLCCRAVLPHMIERRAGRIILVQFVNRQATAGAPVTLRNQQDGDNRPDTDPRRRDGAPYDHRQRNLPGRPQSA